MPLRRNRPSNIVAVSGYLPDAGAASSVYLVAPTRGWLKSIKVAQHAANDADNTFTVAIAGYGAGDYSTFTAYTFLKENGSAFIQTATGSAAGVSHEAFCSTCYVSEGDTIRVTSDGNSSGTVPCQVQGLVEAH